MLPIAERGSQNDGRMNAMRMGFLTGSIAKIGSGRTEAVPLARGLSRLGCTVFGIETSRIRRSRVSIEDLEVHREPLAGHLTPDLPAFLARRNRDLTPTNRSHELPIYFRATGRAIHSLTRKLDLDVVYAFHNTNAAAVLQSWPDARRVLAINLIGFGIDPSRGGASDTFPLQQRIFDRPSWDLHVTATRFEYDQYRRVYEYLGIDERKLMHLPHCVDEEVFTPGDRDPNGRANRSIQTILYPVNVYPRKNIELALEVLAIVSSKIDCRLIVTGSVWDRPYRDRLLALAKRLGVGDRVSFLGGVPLEELVRLYQNSDVTVYTSHQETFGLGIAESLACGTPVVGPDWIIPCREILLQASGGTAAQKEPASFAATLLAAMSNQPDKISIAEDARRRFGNRSIAAAFLARCREIRDAKEATAKRVRSIDWKGMYEDAGDLL